MEPLPPGVPSRLKKYTAAIQKLSLRTGTPLPSLILSFALLHEVTAIVPLIGIYWAARAFRIGDKMTAYLSLQRTSQNSSEDKGSETSSTNERFVNEALRRWMREGEARAARVGARYGILGFTKNQEITEDDMQRVGTRVASEVANGAFAYMAVKVGFLNPGVFYSNTKQRYCCRSVLVPRFTLHLRFRAKFCSL